MGQVFAASACCTCAVHSGILCTSPTKANTHTHAYIHTYTHTVWEREGERVVCLEAKQIERLISTKASPIDLCTGKWYNGCPTGCWRSRTSFRYGTFPVLFQCKRQPNVCPQLESLCETTADYVGISVVVSHKYARTQTLAHTERTHTNTLTYSMVSSKWAEPWQHKVHSLVLCWLRFVCMYVCMFRFCMCVCAIFYELHGNSKTPTSSTATATTTTTTTTTKAK